MMASTIHGGEEQGLLPAAITRLHKIAVPTLVVVGDLENADTCNVAEILTADIPQARLQVIADTAHLPSMERPAEFNRILADFLIKIEV